MLLVYRRAASGLLWRGEQGGAVRLGAVSLDGGRGRAAAAPPKQRAASPPPSAPDGGPLPLAVREAGAAGARAARPVRFTPGPTTARAGLKAHTPGPPPCQARALQHRHPDPEPYRPRPPLMAAMVVICMWEAGGGEVQDKVCCLGGYDGRNFLATVRGVEA